MHLGRTQQVVILMLVWAAALVGVDKTLNHAPVQINAMSGHGKPQIVVTFTHFCCTGCYDKMFSAARSMSLIVTATTDRTGLKKQEDLQKDTVDAGVPVDTQFEKDAQLLLDEGDLKSVDLVRVQREFRDAGLVPRRIVLENIPHFRLIAVDPHLCCGLCEGAATNAMKLEQSRVQALATRDDPSITAETAKTQYMPSFTVDPKAQRITAEYYQRADVTGFQMAMEHAGFSPKEIRIEVLGGAK